MKSSAAAITVAKFLAAAAPQAAAATQRGARNPFLHFLLGCGIFGLFLVSIVDSSFVPLPLPGITDIMIIVLAAQHSGWFLLILLATAGSALGGYFSYQVGQRGGMAFLERHVPPRIFKRVCEWMENHAILSVALPAILPPPMPLSPFVLAAGALKMSLRRFMTAFTISRALRHGFCVWLGMHYGRVIIRTWNRFYARWDNTMFAVICVLIAVSIGVPIYTMWKEARLRKVMGVSGLLEEIEGK